MDSHICFCSDITGHVSSGILHCILIREERRELISFIIKVVLTLNPPESISDSPGPHFENHRVRYNNELNNQARIWVLHIQDNSTQATGSHAELPLTVDLSAVSVGASLCLSSCVPQVSFSFQSF